MGRGRRYDGEQKLNIKKVIVTILLLVILISIIVFCVRFPKKSNAGETKNISNSYLLEYIGGRWGVINSKGETVIKPIYEDMIVIPDYTKGIFICQSNVNLEDGTYTSKAIDTSSNQLFTSYDSIEAIQNIKENGQVFYSDNILKVSKDGKFGLINLSGKELVPCLYDSIEPIKYVTNSFVTEKNGKFGLVDNGGDVIIENKYTEINSLTKEYENGYIVKDENGKFGIINYNKKQVLECKYDEIKNVYGSNMYVVKEDGNLELITSDGTVKLKNKFNEVISIDNSNLILKSGDKYSVITADGEKKLSDYEYLKYAFDGNYIAKKDGQYGIINLSEESKVAFECSSINYRKDEGFIEMTKADGTTNILDTNFAVKVTGIVSEINTTLGYVKIRVGTEYKYYNLKLEEKSAMDIFTTNTLFLSKKNGKYGYINKNGVVIVDYIYDDATEQNTYGYSGVKKDGKWGAIDQTGNVVLEPSLALSQNTVISFIGKLHLAPDLNANYYTDINE